MIGGKGLRWPFLLLSLLAVLAALQYRWTGQISAAGKERMAASLRSSLRQLSADLDAEFVQVLVAFRLEPQDDLGAALRARWDRFRSESNHPELVESVFRVSADGRLSTLTEGERLQSIEWPAPLMSLREGLQERRLPPPGGQRGDPRRPRGGPARPPMPFPLLFGEPPALALPVGAPRRGSPRFELDGFVLVTLDSDVLAGTLLPELTARYFGDDYDVLVLDGADAAVFSSNGRPSLEAPDAAGELLSLRRLFGGRDREPPRPPPEFRDVPRDMGGARWRILVRHRAGSLDAEVERVRRRNLAVSFGILGILGASIVLVTVSARRATELSNQKMEFVAGVSHELRTPVAVVRSAGQNLADGSVTDPAAVKRYGALIDSEGRRLNDLIEQVLELAGIHAQRREFRPTSVPVGPLLAQVLADAETLRAERGATVDVELAEPDLAVLAEADALRRAIGNVVMNALKHGGRDNAVRVRVARAGPDIAIEVTDRGPGISAEERERIFEPFYRGGRARRQQIAGSGLGLSLVQNVMSEHGGSVTLGVPREGGCRFTLTIPGAEAAADAGDGNG